MLNYKLLVLHTFSCKKETGKKNKTNDLTLILCTNTQTEYEVTVLTSANKSRCLFLNLLNYTVCLVMNKLY